MSRQVGDEESAAYTALIDDSSPSTPVKRASVAVRVVAAAALLGLLIVGLLFGSFRNGGNALVGGDDALVCALSPVRAIPAAAMVAPISRGVAEGVSEKSNLMFGGAREVESFPWNNSTLSWQRTAFHFQPEKNWMSDPNGPMFYKGWYHFFYQYNPKGAVWGDIAWGHAVSRDLVHWLDLPLAMVADEWFDVKGVFSGSATILPDGRVIMLYTGATEAFDQIQNLVYPANLSDPLLIDWVKYPGNPILVPPPGIQMQDFRDPSTAWLTSEQKWRITIGTKMNRTGIALVYETEDFINYELLQGEFHGVSGTGMWECMDFYPVSLSSDKGLDTSENGPGLKHVMKASMDDDRHDYYAIGVYDEKLNSWVPDNADIDVGYGIRHDYGQFYASKSFYDPEKQRRILWAYIHESDSEVADVQKGWACVQGVLRTLILDKKTGTYLLQWPIEEIDDLRLGSNQFDNIIVKPGSVVPLDVGTAYQVDIVAEFELDKAALAAVEGTDAKYECSSSGGAAGRGALGPFGLLVFAEHCKTEQTPVYFYMAKGSDSSLKTYVCHDQSRSSLANDVIKSINGGFVPVLKGEKLSLRILVDHSIIETFAQGGRTCITSRVYPTRAIFGDAKILLFNNATSTSIKASVKVWQMDSAFIQPYNLTQ